MDGERKGKPVNCHDDFERILVAGDTEELNELKDGCSVRISVWKWNAANFFIHRRSSWKSVPGSGMKCWK